MGLISEHRAMHELVAVPLTSQASPTGCEPQSAARLQCPRRARCDAARAGRLVARHEGQARSRAECIPGVGRFVQTVDLTDRQQTNTKPTLASKASVLPSSDSSRFTHAVLTPRPSPLTLASLCSRNWPDDVRPGSVSHSQNKFCARCSHNASHCLRPLRSHALRLHPTTHWSRFA